MASYLSWDIVYTYPAICVSKTDLQVYKFSRAAAECRSQLSGHGVSFVKGRAAAAIQCTVKSLVAARVAWIQD